LDLSRGNTVDAVGWPNDRLHELRASFDACPVRLKIRLVEEKTLSVVAEKVILQRDGDRVHWVKVFYGKASLSQTRLNAAQVLSLFKYEPSSQMIQWLDDRSLDGSSGPPYEHTFRGNGYNVTVAFLYTYDRTEPWGMIVTVYLAPEE